MSDMVWSEEGKEEKEAGLLEPDLGKGGGGITRGLC